jgi:Leucine rich repeat
LKVFGCIETSEATKVSCEKIQNYVITGVKLMTCLMKETTVINAADMRIATNDESVERLMFTGNKKIAFLPIQVAEVFPNLEKYKASACSVKEIAKKNFAGLNKLKNLHLRGNQIEKIYSNTFEGLTSLIKLKLRKKI